MKMKKNKFILLIAMMFTLAVLAACSSENEASNSESGQAGSDGNLKIGVVLKQLNTEYWKIVMAGAKDAAKELGAEVKFLGPQAETQYEQQIKMIEDQIATGANALVVAPSQPDSVIPALNNAHQSGIPVVLVDTDANFKDKVSYIGTGNVEAGQLAGKHIAEVLKDGDKVAILRGQMGSQTFDDRVNGFQEALADKDIEFIVQDAQHDREKSVNIMENILTANPDIKAVYATSDEMALGAAKALANEGKQNIPLIGFDGTPNGLAALQDGVMVANIAQDPYNMGFQAIEAAVKAVKGEKVEKRIDSGAKVITEENVAEAIEEINGNLGK
ncbi:sugar ABC transporter substrate-binding protein [Bacillus sp. SD075]|uniref:sugar ABC transporter substrate-binding protein n=1 Tax=Bacillus sp. SD075 TaxID=2781732 RepID=UPI001A95BE9A|nr:sugar ABC transporter substrate-binding protein [Bacillus sp. SD075]MBO0997538.1 sugar ABC transporter substrate-binding protein [Bacillus sp. SD075]